MNISVGPFTVALTGDDIVALLTTEDRARLDLFQHDSLVDTCGPKMTFDVHHVPAGQSKDSGDISAVYGSFETLFSEQQRESVRQRCSVYPEIYAAAVQMLDQCTDVVVFSRCNILVLVDTKTHCGHLYVRKLEDHQRQSLGDTYILDIVCDVFRVMSVVCKNALLLHAASVVIDNAAYLFLGPSGSGKTTVTQLLGRYPALSDDTSFLVQAGGQFTAYCTPWWSTESVVRFPHDQYRGMRVAGFFFLQHGESTRFQKIAHSEALSRIFLDYSGGQNELRWASIDMQKQWFSVATDLCASCAAYDLTVKKSESFESEFCPFVKELHSLK